MPPVDELSIWTIYKSPKDYPGKYVARRFSIQIGRTFATPDVVVKDHLEPLRDLMMDKGLTQLHRAETDEGHIVESWI